MTGIKHDGNVHISAVVMAVPLLSCANGGKCSEDGIHTCHLYVIQKPFVHVLKCILIGADIWNLQFSCVVSYLCVSHIAPLINAHYEISANGLSSNVRLVTFVGFYLIVVGICKTTFIFVLQKIPFNSDPSFKRYEYLNETELFPLSQNQHCQCQS